MAQVELLNLTRHFEGSASAAVDGVTLTIESGEFVVLVGPSGCGKSTALRLLAGLDIPDGGDVRIEGRSMRNVPPQDRDTAMVFQGYALYPHMKARDIIGFPLKMQGVAKAERQRRVEETADLLSIRRLLDRRPAELSGGEQQRVAMGRALVRRPKVFLFDEPLSNLDAALRAEIRVEIGSLVRKLEATTVYVTHDHVEAMTLGDRIAVIRAGKLEQVGTPREIYERPATAFVASFLGSPPMNLSRAKREGTELVSGSLRLRVAADGPSFDDLFVGVRPEHIHLSSEPPKGHVHADASVVAVEPLGSETHVHLEAGETSVRVRVPGFDAPSRGDHVKLHFDPEQIHAFEPTEPRKRIDVVLRAP